MVVLGSDVENTNIGSKTPQQKKKSYKDSGFHVSFQALVRAIQFAFPSEQILIEQADDSPNVCSLEIENSAEANGFCFYDFNHQGAFCIDDNWLNALETIKEYVEMTQADRIRKEQEESLAGEVKPHQTHQDDDDCPFDENSEGETDFQSWAEKEMSVPAGAAGMERLSDLIENSRGELVSISSLDNAYENLFDEEVYDREKNHEIGGEG